MGIITASAGKLAWLLQALLNDVYELHLLCKHKRLYFLFIVNNNGRCIDTFDVAFAIFSDIFNT